MASTTSLAAAQPVSHHHISRSTPALANSFHSWGVGMRTYFLENIPLWRSAERDYMIQEPCHSIVGWVVCIALASEWFDRYWWWCRWCQRSRETIFSWSGFDPERGEERHKPPVSRSRWHSVSPSDPTRPIWAPVPAVGEWEGKYGFPTPNWRRWSARSGQKSPWPGRSVYQYISAVRSRWKSVKGKIASHQGYDCPVIIPAETFDNDCVGVRPQRDEYEGNEGHGPGYAHRHRCPSAVGMLRHLMSWPGIRHLRLISDQWNSLNLSPLIWSGGSMKKEWKVEGVKESKTFPSPTGVEVIDQSRSVLFVKAEEARL